jgi:tetratricopeptide (TPR) repeat protein
MAFCLNCGTQLPDGAKFCPECGTAVGAASAQANPPTAGGAEEPAEKLTLQELEDLLETDAPALQAMDKAELARTINKKGVALFDSEDYGMALKCFSHAISLNPQNATFFSNRGRIHLELHDNGKALADSLRAIELNPGVDINPYETAVSCYEALGDAKNTSKYLAGAARIFNQKEKYKTALNVSARAIKLDPNNALAYHMHGWAVHEESPLDYKTPLEDLNRAIELDPTDCNFYWARALLLGPCKEAFDDLDKAIELDPDRAGGYYEQKGYFYVDMKRGSGGHFGSTSEACKAAIAAFTAAIEYKGDYGDSRVSNWYAWRGYCYADEGGEGTNSVEDTRAFADLNTAIELDSENGEAYAFLALLYYKRNDPLSNNYRDKVYENLQKAFDNESEEYTRIASNIYRNVSSPADFVPEDVIRALREDGYIEEDDTKSAAAAPETKSAAAAPPASAKKPAAKKSATKKPAKKPAAPERDEAYWEEARWLATVRFEKDSDGYIFKLDKVPEKFRTEAVCYAAAKRSMLNLQYVPEHILTEDLCLSVITAEYQHYECLSYIPERFRTYAVCLAAIQFRGAENIAHVPKALYDERLFVEYAKYLDSVLYIGDDDEDDVVEPCFNYIGMVPEKFRTKAFWLARIASWTQFDKNGPVKEFPLIPRKLLSPELCFLAVRKHGMVLEFVPREYITYEMCLTAVGTAVQGALNDIRGKADLAALRFVPEEFKTYNLCLAAVMNCGPNLAFVPESMKDEHICRAAIGDNFCAFQFIPDRFKTKDMCLGAAYHSPNLKYIPEAFKTEKICETAAKHCFDYYAYLSDDTECMLQYVPPQFRTSYISLSMMGKNTEIWKYIPPEIVNRDFCVSAMEKSVNHYDFIPEKYRAYWKIRDLKEHGDEQ